MRIACLLLPDFFLAALLRADPELRGQAVAVVREAGERAPLVSVSPEAARRGLTPGMSVAQARNADDSVAVRLLNEDGARAAQAALGDVGDSFSPRVEDAGDGVVYLDAGGLHSLFPTESALANAMSQRAQHLGLEIHVGLASTKVAAYLAARDGGGVTVVPPGEEWSVLAPMPVGLLLPSPVLAQTLRRWGLGTIGALAALPASAVGARLGPEGVALVRRARGEDEHPLTPRSAPIHFEEGMDLDYGLDNVEPLIFVLRRLIECLTARLGLRGLVCGDLRLSLRLANRARDARTVTVAAPSNDVKSLLALARLHLETHPPAAAVEAVRVTAVPESLRASQLDLFRPAGPAPERLAVTLARLTALCGADRVGVPMIADSHRPDAYGLGGWESREQKKGLGTGGWGLAGERNEIDPRASRTLVSDSRASYSGQPPAPSPQPLLHRPPAPSPQPLLHRPPTPDPRPPAPEPGALALRAFRPPRAAEVHCDRGRMDFVRGEGFAGRVVHVAGPWRVQTDWWSEQASTRDYYDVQLSDGGVYRLYCERLLRAWFVDGIYD